MPIIRALPNDDCPGTALIRASSGSAMVIQMAAAGTSDMIVEIVEVPTMNASTTRRLSLPDRVRSATAKRRARPLPTMTSAMQNMVSTNMNGRRP